MEVLLFLGLQRDLHGRSSVIGAGAYRPQQEQMVQHNCQHAGYRRIVRLEPTLKTWLSANHCCLSSMLGPGLSLYCATIAATAALVSSMPIAWPMQALQGGRVVRYALRAHRLA